MSLDDKSKELARRAEALAEKQRRAIQRAYQAVADDVAASLSKLRPLLDGGEELSRSALYKFDRLSKLQAQVLAALDRQHAGEVGKLNGYLAEQYDLGYFFTGYALENETGVSLAYAMLNPEQLREAALSDLSRISLKAAQAATRGKLQQALVLSVARGETIDKLAERTRVALGENANNAYRIARTETTRVSNAAASASLDHARQRGLPLLKKWISTLDGKTRDSHQHLDGETVELDDEFSNGLSQPGELGGPPEEVINCRCRLGTALKGYENETKFRRARGTEGKNELIEYKRYEDWRPARVAPASASAKAAAESAAKAQAAAAAAEVAAKAAAEKAAEAAIVKARG